MKVRNRFYLLLNEIVDGGQGGGEAPAVVSNAPAAEPTDMWNDMIDFDDSAVAPTPPVESEPSEPAQPAVEPQKAEEPPKAPEPPPAVEPPKADEPVKAQEPTTSPTPPEPPTTPVDYAALRVAELERLSQAYALPADQATALLTEPETVLPKLAAKLHQDIMTNVLAVMQAHLPQAVETVTAQRIRESEAKQEFYSAWPELKGYEKQVLAAGAMFRQINPTAPKEQAVQAIGQLAMQALGLTRAVAPTAPPPAPVPQAVPFTPAGGRSGGTPPPKPAPTVWDEMMNVDAYD